MSKVNEALEILKSFGMPEAQQNERSALTLLSLADVKTNSKWSEARSRNVRIHDVLNFIEKNYKKKYAENSRETIRRQTLHQFEQGGIAIRNADNPKRSTNSPNNVYSISDAALKAIKTYGTKNWNPKLKEFIKVNGKLIEAYDKRSASHKIQLILPDKTKIALSPGKHNELQISVIQEFTKSFCPKARVLYIGDVAKKIVRLDEELLEELHIPLNAHDKLPDIVLYDMKSQILFLIEVVTSHGPVSPKRKMELEQAFTKSDVKRIYVTAFQNFGEFKRHIDKIAWETEVWIAEKPQHMIHFNGDKFLNVLDN